MSDDGLPDGVWRLDDETRQGMRVSRIREALAEEAYDLAVTEAEELLDEVPAHAEGLFLLGEALLHLADFEIARMCYERRIEVDGGDTSTWLGLAIAAFQSCDLDTAVQHAQRVVQAAPDNAEAHYYLGLGLERMPGRATDAMAHLTAAMQLEPDRFPLPMQLDADDWRRVVYGALNTLHPQLQRFYVGMDFRLEDLPPLEELRANDPPLPPMVGAMYVGDPPALQGDAPATERPEAMRLFTRNLGRSPTEDDLVDQLGMALHDEAVHWLGLTPEDLEQD